MEHSGCTPEDKEQVEAAWILGSLKHTQFDRATLAALEELKTRFLQGKRPGEATNGQQMECSLPGNHLCGHSSSGYIPPDTPPVASLRGLISQCSKPIEKQLTESDVKDDQCRLSINRALVEERLMHLLGEDEDITSGIPVAVYDSEGNQYQMMFKLWAGKYYVLITGWKQFYKDHELRKDEDFVTVWMFRHAQTRKLCFVITSRRLPVPHPVKRRKLKS